MEATVSCEPLGRLHIADRRELHVAVVRRNVEDGGVNVSVAAFRGHGNNPSGFIKDRILPDELSYCQFLDNDLNGARF
jgi:hypothetical protein